MKKLFIILSVLIIASLPLISCGGSQPPTPTEQAASDQYTVESSNPEIIIEGSTPNYDLLETDTIYNASNKCNGFWPVGMSTDPKFTGFTDEVKFVSVQKNEEMKTATITWVVRLYSIEINDRIVYPESWTVVQKIPDNNTMGGFYLTQEINPDPWIAKAKELAKLATPLKLTQVAVWEMQEGYNSYYWSYGDYVCSVK